MGLELPDDAVGAALGAAEDEGLAVVLDELGRDGHPLGPIDLPEVVGHVALGLLGGLDGDPDRVPLVVADDRLHLASDGGREEEDLAVRRRLVEQAAHRGKEPHVGHAIGLVEHDGRDIVEEDVAPLDQVLEASRAGHHDVDALVQGPHLVAVARAAEDGHDPLAVLPHEPSDDLVHLRGQLACRHEDERPRAPGRDCTVLTTSGRPKASVLPDPVGALPQMSRPAKAGGIVSD